MTAVGKFTQNTIDSLGPFLVSVHKMSVTQVVTCDNNSEKSLNIIRTFCFVFCFVLFLVEWEEVVLLGRYIITTK